MVAQSESRIAASTIPTQRATPLARRVIWSPHVETVIEVSPFIKRNFSLLKETVLIASIKFRSSKRPSALRLLALS
jgi:hypothetical protein